MDTARNIRELIFNSLGPTIYQFESDDEITVYYGNIQITIDFDIQWCRIHKSWVLKRAIDLSSYWEDAKKCSEMIIEAMKIDI
jgi:hypothetical protein